MGSPKGNMLSMILFVLKKKKKSYPCGCMGQRGRAVYPGGRLDGRDLGGGNDMEGQGGYIWEMELTGFAEGLDMG